MYFCMAYLATLGLCLQKLMLNGALNLADLFLKGPVHVLFTLC